MTLELIFIIGAVYNFGFALTHLFLPLIFKWREALEPVNEYNRNLMHILNLFQVFIHIVFGVGSILFPIDLMTTDLGKFFLAAIASYWFLRAVIQIIFFGFKSTFSFTIFMFNIVGIFVYLSPLIISVKLNF